jgi:Mg2+ and Co2+ transporter CorA
MWPRTVTKTATNGGDDAEEGPRIGAGLRKKGMGVRAWLLLDASGQAQVVEAGKHAIMRRTGLPARDLRILDPLLSYPFTILGRERAIVINLEHIKAIITAQEVLLLNSRDPAVVPFIADLQRRLHVPTQQEGRNSDMDADVANKDILRTSPSEKPDTWGDDSKPDMNAYEDGPKVLPFEFRALEACLEAACSCLESETTILEEEAYPALDELTSKISTLNLERVRQIKSRLVAISGRVQKVRDELEHLLDDDEDMAEMYLTDKLRQHYLDGNASPSSFYGGRDGMEYEPTQSDAEEERSLLERHTDPQNLLSSSGNHVEGPLAATKAPSRNEYSSSSSGSHSGTKSLDVEELEMLLEAYFVQIDSTLNKLSALREYVDDTEDYINIMLDDKQNHLLQMGVMLTTATLVISAFVVVAGIFGMNITIDLFDEDRAGLPEFLWTVGGCATGSIFLYIVAIAWCKHRRLLE